MAESLAELTRASFEAHLHSRFALRTTTGELALELVEVKTLGAARPPRREPFSLIFRGPRDLVVRQGTYPLEHDVLGTLGIFIVPLGPDASGVAYEAIFA